MLLLIINSWGLQYHKLFEKSIIEFWVLLRELESFGWNLIFKTGYLIVPGYLSILLRHSRLLILFALVLHVFTKPWSAVQILFHLKFTWFGYEHYWKFLPCSPSTFSEANKTDWKNFSWSPRGYEIYLTTFAPCLKSDPRWHQMLP